ncbi:MAG: PKD domain-containing protein [Cyclobacteriaceae bacterium]|nr:PKD domain-containing protein [Cyclobacteriaceae bacterium]
MKKFYLVWSLLLISTLVSGQILADFESPSSTPTLTPAGAAVVNNPDKTGNPSDKVAYYIKAAGNWQAIYLNFGSLINIGKQDRLTFKLRSSTQGRVFVKVVASGTTILENWAPEYNFRPEPGKWTECSLDISALVDQQFDRIEVNASVDNEALANVYLDDFKLVNSRSPNGEPIVDVVVTPAEVTLGESMQFDASGSVDLDGSIVSYTWNFGDGATASGDVVEHTYAMDGIFNIALVVEDNSGLKSYWNSSVNILPATGKLGTIQFTPNAHVHEKVEGIFLVKGTFNNVYDPDEIKVDAIITRPDLTTITVPCFYYQKATYKAAVDQWAREPGAGYWMLRFSSPQAGQHQVKLQLTDAGGTVSSGITSVAIQPGQKKGYIKIDAASKQHFRHTTGEPFYPMGINAAWDNTTNYTKIINNLGAGGANVVRYWQVPFDRQGLEWKNGSGFYKGLGVYSQEAAAEQDSIFRLCEVNDLYVQITIFQHGMFSETVNSNWSDNPYNSANGGPLTKAEQYFYNAAAKARTKKLLRYIVARWGYSQNLFAWELFNEVNFTGDHPNQTAQWLPAVMSWHDEMGQYIKALDAFDHPVTTSSDESHLAQMDKLTGLDNVQYHLYNTNLLSVQTEKDRSLRNAMTRTGVINGEYGLDVTTADVPFDVQRVSIWTGVMTQVPHLMWLWNNYTTASWANLFKYPAQYLADEDFIAKGSPSDWIFDVRYNTGKLSSVGFRSGNDFYAIVYDGSNRNNLSNVSCDFAALPSGNYSITLFNTLNGTTTTEEREVSSTSGKTYTLPVFSKAVALKVKLNFPIIVGVDELDEGSAIKLYPNPAKGDLFIEFPTTGFTKAEWLDVTGRIVMEQSVDPTQLSVEMKIDLPAGLYVIRLLHETNVHTRKVLVK